MKRWRRRLILIALLLLAGAVVNVAVAWWIAAHARVTVDYRFPTYLSLDDARPKADLEDTALRAMGFIWSMNKASVAAGIGEIRIEEDAPWPSQTPSGWPPRCLRADWIDFGVRWSGAVSFDDGCYYAVHSYSAGWPLKTIEIRYLYSGRLGSPVGAGRIESASGVAAPEWLGRGTLYHGSKGRIPTALRLAGFAGNTAFYSGAVAAILALPLSVFPIRRRLRTRRGRCPRCGYDLAELADAAAACPECGAAR